MRILLIEDHAIFREALRELLHAKDPGFEVVAEAATAHDACQAAEQHHPDVTIMDLAKVWPRLGELAPKIAEQIEVDAKYDVYLSRQAADIAAYRRDESFKLPDGFDYATLPGLSNEMKQKLQTHRPRTIGQAGRIDGVTPAALTLLAAHVRRGKKATAKSA